MVIYYNIGANFSTPEHRTPSDPTWSAWTPNDSLFTPPKSTLQTPCGGKKSTSRTAGLPRSRASPYMTPEQSRISVFKPKDLIEKARQKKASLMSSPMTAPTHPHVAGSTDTPGRPWTKPKSKLFPPNSGVRKRLPMVKPRPLVSPPMQGTPRRVLRKPLQDTSRPTVELLRVLNKCWDEDGAKESSWALTDGLLNGRNDERDRSGRWKVLGHAVGSLWPDLRGWIMANAPEDGDTNWFISQRKIDIDDEIEGCIHDPKLATKDSTVDRVGFHMASSTYDAACGVLKELSGKGTDFQCLVNDEINPFFLIYAFADCNIPLPTNFSRQLLWKHLDAIVRAKCWRGLGYGRTNPLRDTSAEADRTPPRGGDQDVILESLLKLSYRKGFLNPALALEPTTVTKPAHRLKINIADYKWIVEGQMGSIWYEAGDLVDEDDVACFAVIDLITRLLPSCRGGILEITTADFRLLWGAGGARSSAWSVVQDVCMGYQVTLRGKWTSDRLPSPDGRIDPKDGIIVPPRKHDVVNAVLNKFREDNLDSSRAAYRCMMNHLQVTTTT